MNFALPGLRIHMAMLLDHLWQSTLVVLLIWLLAMLVRSNGTVLQLWLWRIAAFKILLPFSLLFAVGGWIGFPVRHSAVPPPDALRAAVASVTQWTSPSQSFAPTGLALAGAALLLLGIAFLCAWGVAKELPLAARIHRAERAKAGADPWLTAPPLGMFKAVTLAAAAFCLITAPMLAGALHDRIQRQEALAADITRLRGASITLTETPSRFGARTEILARPDGVLIRHVNLQDLVALVYGIGQFEVFGGALPWLSEPHYNVEVRGPVSRPAVFDPYALRQPVTDYLFQEYGVSIRVNGNCQEPCLNQESFVVERIPWKLSKMISGRK
jgi:hypothetical protein